jgi:hypothetical protein
MAELVHLERLAAYHDALRNWHREGYVRVELHSTAADFVTNRLAITFRDLKYRLFKHVIVNGGRVAEVAESRELWCDAFEFHHDINLRVKGIPAYVETRLCYTPPFVPDEPFIRVVNVH